jgi:hypothetical protein
VSWKLETLGYRALVTAAYPLGKGTSFQKNSMNQANSYGTRHRVQAYHSALSLIE